MIAVSSPSETYAAPGALPAPANAAVAAVILALVVLSAALSAERKSITQGFDEVAQASYVAQLQTSGEPWPKLEDLRLLDPQTFRFTAAANYLNHPPIFYALLAALGPRLENHPAAMLIHRLLDIALAAAGFAALLGLGLAARWPRHEFYAYAIPLACIPVLVPLAGAINNDNLAFLGGAAATLAVWQRVATGRDAWLALALAGVVAAGWAKLTGLLLSAGMVGAALAYLKWRGRLPAAWMVAALLAALLAAAPYIVFIVQYGSPTPETAAQVALIADGARAAGWSALPRHAFPAYLVHFAGAFVAGWMPALAARNALNDAMLAVPIATLGCALAGIALSLCRLRRRRETALDVVVLAGTLAIGATFAIHVWYSYGRYLATGWLMDAYPRYYLPLAAVVPLACLSLVAAVEAPRPRAALLASLIVGPVLFRLFGAPLG